MLPRQSRHDPATTEPAPGLSGDRRRHLALVSVGSGGDVGADPLLRQIMRHRMRVHATVASLPPDAVLSHVSAACMHGLPLWDRELPALPVQVIRPVGRGRGARSGAVDVRSCRLDPEEITVVDGLPVTTVARTLIDMARWAPFESAVVCADGALHGGLVTPADLDTALARVAGTQGVLRARAVLAFADGRSQSTGETRSRVAFHRAGVPEPALQIELESVLGIDLGHADFGWFEFGVLGEFDGEVPYGRLAPPGGPSDAHIAVERDREEQLRAQGWTVVRWTWADLDDDTALVKVEQALDPAAGHR